MEFETIYVSNLTNEEQQNKLEQRLFTIDGVQKVCINQRSGQIDIEFETPASLNNLEKEVYDLGFEIIN